MAASNTGARGAAPAAAGDCSASRPGCSERSRAAFALYLGVGASIAALALSACGPSRPVESVEKGPDFYKEVSITYEVAGETRTMSRAVGCTHHLTGAGGMLGASNTAFGDRLPSGAAVLFFLPRHPCYPDWRVPFNPPLSSDPEQRWRELYPTVLWLDDADDPELIEFSPFFATVEAGNARVIVREVGLQDVERDAPDGPAPGVGWLSDLSPEERDIRYGAFLANRLEYDVVIIVPQAVWSDLDKANEIVSLPIATPLPAGLVSMLRMDLNVWRMGLSSRLEMIPAADPDSQPEVDPRVLDWIPQFSHEERGIVVEDTRSLDGLIFRARRPARNPAITNVRYKGVNYPLGEAAVQTGENLRVFAGFRTTDNELVLLQRALIPQPYVNEDF